MECILCHAAPVHSPGAVVCSDCDKDICDRIMDMSLMHKICCRHGIEVTFRPNLQTGNLEIILHRKDQYQRIPLSPCDDMEMVLREGFYLITGGKNI